MRVNGTDKSKEFIAKIRGMLVTVYNSYAQEKIIFDGSETTDILNQLKDNPENYEKNSKVIGFILEIEGFEEANADLSEREMLKKLKKLEKRIRKEFQEV